MAYIGNPPISGNFQVCDAISVVNGQAAYTMQVSSANVSPESANHMLVSLNGVLQKPNSSFTISSSTITFASNLATGDVIDFILLLGNVNDIGTPSDATVTNAKTNFTSTSSAAGLQIKGDGTTDGTLQLNCSQNSHGIKLASPAHSAGQSYTMKFPTGNITADRFLKVASISGSGTSAVGQLSFAEAGGTHVLLSTTTVSSGVATVDITTNIDSTYKKYMIDVIGMHIATDDQNIDIQVFNSSIETGSVYSQFSVDGNQTSATPGGVATQDTGVGITIGLSVGNDSIEQLNSRIFLNNPSETTFNKLIEFSSVYHDSSEKSSYTAGVGNCTDVAAITGIRFKTSSGNINGGVIKLYGIT